MLVKKRDRVVFIQGAGIDVQQSSGFWTPPTTKRIDLSREEGTVLEADQDHVMVRLDHPFPALPNNCVTMHPGNFWQVAQVTLVKRELNIRWKIRNREVNVASMSVPDGTPVQVRQACEVYRCRKRARWFYLGHRVCARHAIMHAGFDVTVPWQEEQVT